MCIRKVKGPLSTEWRARVLALAMGVLALVATPGDADPPNILFVLTDDQGWPTLGAYGGEMVDTPHLDKLASEGALLTDFYVTSQCSPTRATFMTGQYTARHGLWHVLPWYGYPWARMTEPAFAENFPRENYTIAKGLRAAGYRTAIVGKWHLTSNEDGNYMGLNPQAAHHYGFDYAPPLLDPSEFADGNDRGVEELTDYAIDFIAKSRAKPWFCFLSHHMIHGKVVAPDPVVQTYRAKGFDDQTSPQAVYLAGLELIDRSIGRLLEALDSLGESDETVVIFTSDNGGIYKKFRYRDLEYEGKIEPKMGIENIQYDNAPLRMGKGSVYEGGVRVPFIVRWPGAVAPGRRIETPAHIVDLLPTFLELADGTLPRDYVIDGQSLLPLFRGEESGRDSDRPVFQYYPFYDLNWGLTPSASVRLGDYKLIEFFGDRVRDDGQFIDGHHFELYNLRLDPSETRNLAQSDRKTTQSLRQILEDWYGKLDLKRPTRNEHFDPARRMTVTKERQPWNN